MYKPMEMTERIKRVRETYKRCPVVTEERPFYYSGDRWMSLYFLRGWVKYKEEPTLSLRRAKAEAYILECSEPLIYEDELIVGQLDFHKYTQEEQEEFDRLYEAFGDMAPNSSWFGRTDHLALDYEKLLKVGVEGLILEIEEKLAGLSFGKDTLKEDVEKEDFYQGALWELRALLKLADRYAQKAEELARMKEGSRREELLVIAENMRTVPRKPAQTFWQALQAVHFYTFNLFGLYPAGRPDRYLAEYVENDLGQGILSEEFAQELIDNYCLTFTTYNFSRAANGFMLGGRDKYGRTVENRLTFMFLTAGDHIRMSDPNIGLCVTEDMSDELLTMAVKMAADGCAQPAFYNDGEIVSTLMAQGIEEGDAHSYINTTCVEISIAGKSNMWTTCPFVNLLSLIEDLLAEKKEYASFEELFQCFVQKTQDLFAEGNHMMALLQMERARCGVHPLRTSCLVADCIERGQSIDAGGAVYNRVFPTVLGFANTVDSLIAIKKLVFDTGRLSLTELAEICGKNFEGQEALRNYILYKLPHYGNADSECDEMAKRIAELIKRICDGLGTYRKDKTVPGMFSYNVHIQSGETVGATPDGRKCGEPLADSCGPIQGYDVNGPTSMLNSVTSWKNSDFLGGIALNMKFDKSRISPAVMLMLIKGYFAKGGIQVQLNCVDKAELLDACVNPDKHRDLIVRVGGYSDYFVKLSPSLKQEIIKRTEN